MSQLTDFANCIPLSEYELQRAARIIENDRIMVDMGLQEAKLNLGKKGGRGRGKGGPRKRQQVKGSAPTRRSERKPVKQEEEEVSFSDYEDSSSAEAESDSEEHLFKATKARGDKGACVSLDTFATLEAKLAATKKARREEEKARMAVINAKRKETKLLEAAKQGQ